MGGAFFQVNVGEHPVGALAVGVKIGEHLFFDYATEDDPAFAPRVSGQTKTSALLRRPASRPATILA
jgi:hypothetical protein